MGVNHGSAVVLGIKWHRQFPAKSLDLKAVQGLPVVSPRYFLNPTLNAEPDEIDHVGCVTSGRAAIFSRVRSINIGLFSVCPKNYLEHTGVEQPTKIALWNLREMFLPGACNQNSHALLFASGITMIGIPQL